MSWVTSLLSALAGSSAAPPQRAPVQPVRTKPRTRRPQRPGGPSRRSPRPVPRQHSGQSAARRSGQPHRQGGRLQGGQQQQKNNGLTAYHGTPSRENAKAIFQRGFLVGRGNAHGDGVYLSTNIATASAYAGSAGVVLKCSVRGRCCHWTSQLQHQFSQWCQRNQVQTDNSARTAFLIQRGYEVLREGEVLVVLSPQMANPTAWQQRDRRIRVLTAYDSSGRQRIRV